MLVTKSNSGLLASTYAESIFVGISATLSFNVKLFATVVENAESFPSAVANSFSVSNTAGAPFTSAAAALSAMALTSTDLASSIQLPPAPTFARSTVASNTNMPL